jgi:hypothetical protein
MVQQKAIKKENLKNHKPLPFSFLWPKKKYIFAQIQAKTPMLHNTYYKNDNTPINPTYSIKLLLIKTLNTKRSNNIHTKIIIIENKHH